MPNVFLPTVHYYFPNVSPVVYQQDLQCRDVHDVAASTPLDGLICQGVGQDSLRRQLEGAYDVVVDRLGSAEKSRELVYFRLTKPNRR